jgi:hypothetical protein
MASSEQYWALAEWKGQDDEEKHAERCRHNPKFSLHLSADVIKL